MLLPLCLCPNHICAPATCAVDTRIKLRKRMANLGTSTLAERWAPQVLIRVKAVGVNRSEMFTRQVRDSFSALYAASCLGNHQMHARL